MAMIESRNQTSHTYNEKTADHANPSTHRSRFLDDGMRRAFSEVDQEMA